MDLHVNDTACDETWFELWKCRSLEELRLKAAILGVDFERWLRTDGYMWIPRDDGREVLWHPSI